MRRTRKYLWTLIHVTSILSLFLLAVGFGLAVQDIVHPNQTGLTSARLNTEQPETPTGGMLIGLGDSLTRGIGDATGQGYFGMVKKSLQEKGGSHFSAVNLAVNGLTSPELAKQVQQERVQELLKKANWITLTIGGNDLFRGSGRLEKIDEKAAEKSRLAYAENLNQILATIQQQNKEATIFIFGLYNPFGDLPEEKRSSRLVAEWNETTYKVAARFDQVVIVPTFDLFQLQPKQYLYDDHFHPNQLGYKRMAERLLQVINDKPKEAKTVYGK